jgi:hypothetical protein
MIRRTARRLLHVLGPRGGRLRGGRPDEVLPFDMFDAVRDAAEQAAARKLEGVYHKGQKKAWNGRELLPQLVARHGAPTLDPARREAIRALFAVILWGELAAWRISADLALHLEPLEAKMAATSQAHDEARHFYVMHDYLALLGEVPRSLPPATTRVLVGTLRADTLAKKLVGMQMMIEPMALALFQMVRETEVEPVLCDLVAFYERDEARHVALGVLHLPTLLRGLSPLEAAELWRWEFTEYSAQWRMLRELQPHFRALGLDPRRVIEIARNKQIRANQMLVDELGAPVPMLEAFVRWFEARAEWEFPRETYASRREHLAAVWRAATHGMEQEVPVALTDVPV